MAQTTERDVGSRRNPTDTQYLRDIRRYRPLKPHEELALWHRVKRGDRRARDQLVKANLRFVVGVAQKYSHQGVPLPDLINEGNLGLIRAAHRFDGAKNFKFISYAVWWIRQAILSALAQQSRLARIPVNRVGTVYDVSKARAKLEQKLRHVPTHEEIAEAAGMSLADVNEAVRIETPALSLDGAREEDDKPALMDILAIVNDEESPEQIVLDHNLRDNIEHALGKLPERERSVIKLHFGIDGDGPHTLDDIAERMGISRERVRQMRNRALERLKDDSSKERLRPYYGED
jgi:RNA polymerase primary sigma factor